MHLRINDDSKSQRSIPSAEHIILAPMMHCMLRAEYTFYSVFGQCTMPEAQIIANRCGYDG